jgi:hypothetical protein
MLFDAGSQAGFCRKMAHGRSALLNFAEASWVGKNEKDGDFSHVPGYGTEKVLGLRDYSAIEIILIGQTRYLIEFSGEVDGTFWSHLRLKRISVRELSLIERTACWILWYWLRVTVEGGVTGSASVLGEGCSFCGASLGNCGRRS